MSNSCLFCRIINNEIPSKRVYEDEKMIIINDIAPQARLHYLLIPKKHYANVAEMCLSDSSLLGECIKTLASIAESIGLGNGYRIITNKGSDACQSVEHIHIHVLGGEKLSEKMG